MTVIKQHVLHFSGNNFQRMIIFAQLSPCLDPSMHELASEPIRRENCFLSMYLHDLHHLHHHQSYNQYHPPFLSLHFSHLDFLTVLLTIRYLEIEFEICFLFLFQNTLYMKGSEWWLGGWVGDVQRGTWLHSVIIDQLITSVLVTVLVAALLCGLLFSFFSNSHTLKNTNLRHFSTFTNKVNKYLLHHGFVINNNDNLNLFFTLFFRPFISWFFSSHSLKFISCSFIFHSHSFSSKNDFFKASTSQI